MTDDLGESSNILGRIAQSFSGQRAGNTATVLGFLAGAVWFAWGIYLHFATIPVAGYQDRIVPGLSNNPAVLAREWKVYNPGPGNLNGATLEVEVRESYDETTKKFTKGLIVEDGPGVTHDVFTNAGSTRIRFAPTGKSLRYWQCMTCRIYSPDVDWKAAGAIAILHGQVHYDANRLFQESTPSTSTLVWPGLLMLFSALVFGMNKLRDSQAAQKMNEQVDKRVEELKPSLFSEASVRVMEDLRKARIPQEMLELSSPADGSEAEREMNDD